jgi:hypothetical protein
MLSTVIPRFMEVRSAAGPPGAEGTPQASGEPAGRLKHKAGEKGCHGWIHSKEHVFWGTVNT